jgi:hypothetical protein
VFFDPALDSEHSALHQRARPVIFYPRLMFLDALVRPTHISLYIPRGNGLTEEHKDPPYVPRPADVHKLCTSVFKLRNVF